MEQVRNPSASKQRIDANGVVAQYIWSMNHKVMAFEAARALGIVATAKAPRGSSVLPKQKCVLEVPGC